MPANALHHNYVSEAEFLALPESMDRVELLDGEIHMAPAPTLLHQTLALNVAAALRQWARAHGAARAGMSPVDIRFGPDRILQPDAFLFVDDLPDPDHRGAITQIPKVCVEVLSPSNRSYDTMLKRYLYAEAGVEEYWLIDPAGTVLRRFGPGLASTEAVANALTTPLLPGFELPLDELFER